MFVKSQLTERINQSLIFSFKGPYTIQVELVVLLCKVCKICGDIMLNYE